jgi:hypothetical protein
MLGWNSSHLKKGELLETPSCSSSAGPVLALCIRPHELSALRVIRGVSISYSTRAAPAMVEPRARPRLPSQEYVACAKLSVVTSGASR